jgi:hypothetical protein
MALFLDLLIFLIDICSRRLHARREVAEQESLKGREAWLGRAGFWFPCMRFCRCVWPSWACRLSASPRRKPAEALRGDQGQRILFAGHGGFMVGIDSVTGATLVLFLGLILLGVVA